jgi:hypothetical protein
MCLLLFTQISIILLYSNNFSGFPTAKNVASIPYLGITSVKEVAVNSRNSSADDVLCVCVYSSWVCLSIQ